MTKRLWYVCAAMLLCGACCCAAQTSTKLLDERPSANVTNQIPTSQTATADGDLNQIGPSTKTVTNIADPWTGRIAVLMLGAVACVIGGRWSAKAIEIGVSAYWNRRERKAAHMRHKPEEIQ